MLDRRNSILNRFLKSFFFVWILVLLLGAFSVAQAEYERFEAGTTATIGEFVYDDDFVATTTADCRVTIYNPAGSAVVTDQVMSFNANGWYYYDYSIPGAGAAGIWPTTMRCGRVEVGDFVRIDKSFAVGNVVVSSSTIATSVWQNATRSLTSFGTLVSDVWANGTRTLTGAGLTSGSLATQSDILTASSSLAATIPTAVWSSGTRSLTTFGTLVSDVWANGTRTLTSGGSITAADVWSYATRRLSDATLDTGSLATAANLTTATTSLAAVVNANTNTQVGTLSTTVTTASTSIGTQIAQGTTDVNTNTNSQISTLSGTLTTASTSIAAVVNANTNSQITSAISTINSNTDATVLTASSSLAATIPTNVWSSGTRSLTSFGTLVSDVWANGTRTLTSGGSITAADVWSYATRRLSDATLDTGSLATAANLTTATTSLAAVVNANTDSQVSSINSNTNSTIATASSSLASVINANTNSQISSAISTINSNVAATVLTASSSLAATIPTAVWSSGTRSLTTFGSLVADIWSANTQTPWTITTSDFGTVAAGSNYLATVRTSYNGTLTDSNTTPTVTLYDPSRNVIVSGVAMTRISEGTYSYSYTTTSGSPAGTWEAVFSADVDTGKTLSGNDYWTVVSSPAQVIINSISDSVAPDISANVTITNEGLTGYEYQYEWCVVTNINNACGGGDDTFHGVAAKFINPGEDFNTTLSATVTNSGNYFFKLIVYFGDDSSGASRSFTVTGGSGGNPSPGGGGGGGGGGGSSSSQTTTPSSSGADLNGDNTVNSVDFSILLYFWKSSPPFSNPQVDMNKDGKIDSVDFSILLYRWGQ